MPGICVLFVIGQLFLFAATINIGSAQTSVLLNLELLVSIAAAMLLLGERLQPAQSAGVIVVLMALFLATNSKKILVFNRKTDKK